MTESLDMREVRVDRNRFFCGDCITGSRLFIPESSVDLIITDPPYGINGDRLHVHYNRDERFVTGGYVEVPGNEYGGFSLAWIPEAERILRPGGSLYVISGYTNLYHILAALRKTSLCEVNHIIWKYNFGVYTKRKYISSHYHILFYEKPGGRRTFNLESRFGLGDESLTGGSANYSDREDVWTINREYKPGMLKNKNELPSALLIKILQYSSNQDDLVVDFFLGGFSTAKAAIGLNRRVIGFEIGEEIFDARLAELRAISPGHLLRSIQNPDPCTCRNQGKRWADEEVDRLRRRYDELLSEGYNKKTIVALLAKEHGRGRWAIMKALRQSGS